MKNLLKPLSVYTLLLTSLIFEPFLIKNKNITLQNDFSNEISLEQVNQFIDQFDGSESTQIIDFKAVEKDKKHYLLAKCDDEWIYILPLKEKKGGFKIEKSKTINACQSNQLSIEIFQFVDNQIVGCKKLNHKISTR
jgi:hypothetical protein